MANKKETAEQEAEEQRFLAEQVKEPLHHPKKHKAKHESAEGTIQPREGEEFLPPPDPPVVDSPPTDPPAPDAVEDIPQKGAQPEDLATRELNIIPEAPIADPGEEPQPKEKEEEKV